MRVDELDPSVVGQLLLRLPLISMQLGHATPRNTRTYLEGAEEPEVRYVIDVLAGTPTEEIIEKWFGGQDEALRRVADRPPPA
jgi:hypothetical protein